MISSIGEEQREHMQQPNDIPQHVLFIISIPFATFPSLSHTYHLPNQS